MTAKTLEDHTQPTAGSGSIEMRITQLETENLQLRKEIEDLLAVGQIARSVSSTLLIEEVLKGILKGIQKVFGLDRVLLGLVNSGASREEIKLAIGVSASVLQKPTWRVSKDDPIWSRLSEQGQPMILETTDGVVLPAFVRETFPGTFFKAPMIVKGQVLGTIMGDRPNEEISRRELDLLQIFVEHAGIAIENGRLYYDVIRSEEKLKETQGQLVEAERLAVIGQLAVSINHEINNPLCAISLICQTLKRKLQDRAPDLLESLQGIEQNIERICDVTRRVSEIKDTHSTEYLPDQLMINLK